MLHDRQNMKILQVPVLALALTASIITKGEAEASTEAPKEFSSIITNKGKEYTNAKVREVTPAGIKIFHDSGAVTIPFEDLPKDIQDAFGGFDAKAAEQHRETENKRLIAQERAMALEAAKAQQEQQANKKNALIQKAKMPTRVRIKQVTDGGALCVVSIKSLEKFERKTPKPLGGYKVAIEEKWVWSGYSEEWYFVAGLPSHLVDDDTWEGWTLPTGSFPYTNTLGARKTVRRLDVVSPPQQ